MNEAKNECSVDARLLREVIRRLPKEQLDQLFAALQTDRELADAFHDRLLRWRPAADGRTLEELLADAAARATGRKKRFYDELIRYVDRAKMTDSKVYGEAGMDRKLWYRLRDDDKARTSKPNGLKLCIVLHLDYWETYYFVNLSGYAFTPSPEIDKTDFGVCACICNGIYDPGRVDEILLALGAPALFFK